MSKPIAIPTRPEEITAVWLTKALRTSQIIETATVTDTRLESVGDIEGFLAVLVRVHLTYDQLEAKAPITLIAKLPTADLELRAIIANYGMYKREVRAYQEIIPRVKMRTPRCYYSAINESGEQYVLLLEDLAPARAGDQLLGCSADEAKLAIVNLAKLHAVYWNSNLLEEMSWAPAIYTPPLMDQADFQQQSLPTFLDKFDHQLSDLLRQATARYGYLIPTIAQQISQCDETIIHGDYRLDNLFFDDSDKKNGCAVIDWQLLKRGPGPYDVIYFLNSILDVETRRQEGMNFLKLYHQTLLENGVRDYPFEKCLADYRLMLLYLINNVVEAGAYLDLSTERKVTLMNQLLERTTAVLQDHNILGLLDDLARGQYA